MSDEGLDNPVENPRQEAPAAFRVISALLAFAVLGGQLYLALGRNFANVLETPFLPYCLLGAFAIHLATRPGRKELICTLGIAAVSMTWFLSSADKLSWSRIIASGAFAGLTSLTVLAIQVLRLRGSAQTEKLNTLFAGSVFGFSAIFIAAILNLTTKLHPRTYDLYLYAADQGFGFPIIAWVGQLLARNRPLFQSCALVYESLPLAISLLYAYQRSGSRPLGVRVLPAFIGGGGAVYLLYNFLPAAGPYYVFGKAFPYHLPHAPALQMVLLGDVARNAMPSMHLACALLIFWNCRRLPRWIYAGSAVYLVLTALAAIGLGEHYAIDLVVAVPFALLLQSACAPALLRSRPEWKRSLAIGGILTALWIVTARFGTTLFHSGVFTWALSILTLVLSGVARQGMAPAEAEIKPDSVTPVDAIPRAAEPVRARVLA